MTAHPIRTVVDCATTLAGVDALLAERLRALIEDWRAVAGPSADILGEADLPELLDEANAGGKRVRPAMVHWGWIAAGGAPAAQSNVVIAGTALELVHLFALIHDDVMDAAALRRGRPTIHRKAAEAHERVTGRADDAFGDHIAVLAGDLAHAEADHLIGALPAAAREVWRQMMVEIILGQRRDLTGAALARRDLDQVLAVARLKTGSYTVQRPLQLGAMLGGADARAMGSLMIFGAHAGLAFGLRDDVLGTWGDERRTGKPVGDDLAAGKATVLLALAAQRLDQADRQLLARTGIGGDLTVAEIGRLRDAMAACGVRDEVEHLIEVEIANACGALHPSHLTAEGITGLTQAAHQLAWRSA